MAEATQELDVAGTVWVNDPTADHNHPILEMEEGRISVERTDVDEVAIHFLLEGEGQAVASLYTNRMGAFALAGLLHMEASKE